MNRFKLLAICTLLALLLVPAAVFSQEQPAPEHGFIEFGFRGVTGEVYGREGQPGTLPFSNNFRPDLLQSPLNAYSDNRTGFYIPKFDAHVDSVFGSRNYLTVKSASNGFAFEGGGALQRDQTALVTFGQYGHYKIQFRYDQTPHIFSGTTRTLFSSGGQGVWTVDPTLQNSLFNALCKPNAGKTSCASGASAVSVGTISSTISNAVGGNLVANVPGAQLFTQQENRKAITGSMGWNITPDLNLSALFSREHQVGTRPIGLVMATSSTGYMVEAPESINYYTDYFKVGSEFGRKSWDALLGYQGSFFHNGTPSMLVSNPFSNVYSISAMGPATARMDLYPDNQYHQFVSEGALEIGKHINLMANVTPGFLRQNATFQPLTSNPNINLVPPAGSPAYLPETSLNGQVDTLAMNYTAVLKATKNVKVVAKYQHFTYNDNTPEISVNPVTADLSQPTASSYVQREGSSFTNRLFDVGGTWFFTKKNSVKFGYQRGWTDRINREVTENTEDTFYGALDMRLHKTVSLRVSGRHQNRVPQVYDISASPRDVWSRMVDQSARVRNRGDAQLSWDPTQRLGITGFFGTLQDNHNQRGGVNSLVPVGNASISPVLVAGTVPTSIYGPYYAYGVLNNIARNYGVDVNYALTSKIVLFAEYAREKNTGVMIEGRGLSSVCVPTGSSFVIPAAARYANGGIRYSDANSSCDPINDVLNASRDLVHSYYAGVDVSASRKVDLSLYYSLSAGQSFLFADGVNCQVGSNGPNTYCATHFANWKLDDLAADTPAASTIWYQAVGTPGAGGFGFPQKVNRVHDVGIIARFKLTENLRPKFQYIFQQNDNNDWQTMVNPYSFTGGGFSYASPVTDPAGVSALQKMLWLGADQPSYRAHIFAVTLEYHF
jgi:hypothetical protein